MACQCQLKLLYFVWPDCCRPDILQGLAKVLVSCRLGLDASLVGLIRLLIHQLPWQTRLIRPEQEVRAGQQEANWTYPHVAAAPSTTPVLGLLAPEYGAPAMPELDLTSPSPGECAA